MFTAFRRALAEARHDRAHDKLYQEAHGITKRLPPLVWYLLPQWPDSWYMKLKRATLCRWLGHDWVDESWCTPDSGGDAGHCKRCQWSFEHTYY